MKIINTPSRNATPTTPEGLHTKTNGYRNHHTRVLWIYWQSLIPTRLRSDQEAQITQEKTSKSTNMKMIIKMRQILMTFSTEATKRRNKLRAASRENWKSTAALVPTLSPTIRHLKVQVVMRALAKDAVSRAIETKGNWQAGENDW